MRSERYGRTGILLAILMVGAAISLSFLSANRISDFGPAVHLLSPAGRKATGYPQLVSIQPLPEIETEGDMCAWVPASSPARLAFALQQSQQTGASGEPRNVALERPPLRVIRDPNPTFSAVAVDPTNNEIIVQDENLFQIMVYDRMTNTPPQAGFSEPKRIISGHETKVEFNCGLYVDPNNGDIYSVNNDTIDTLTIFSRNVSGDTHPTRELSTPHRTYGIAVDESSQELFLTIQHPPMVVVYNKMAEGDDEPIRVLRGNRTELEDAHGMGLDTKNGWIFVANYGNAASYEDGGGNSLANNRTTARIAPGSGRYTPPSITVYPIKSSGDTPPLRTIKGPNTQLNWPAHIYVDEEHGEVFVANDGTDSILVFCVTDSGDVAPTRVLRGPKTQIKNPTGVYVDTVNDEVVVANMGNHRATVYSRTAQGDTPPLRVIRAAADGTPALQIGNPGAVAYDSKRDEILVPN